MKTNAADGQVWAGLSTKSHESVLVTTGGFFLLVPCQGRLLSSVPDATWAVLPELYSLSVSQEHSLLGPVPTTDINVR